MKQILDEWIVREVIDTLYMARTTFLGITGLDSPQEVAKKSANETAITRRISKAIDIIQQSEQSHIPEGLEEEIEIFCEDMWNSLPNFNYSDGKAVITVVEKAASHFAEWGRKQVLQEIYDGKTKPVDKITAAWLTDEQNN